MSRWLQLARRLPSRLATSFNFPTLLIWLRVAMTPLVVGVFYVPDTRMTLPVKNLTAVVPFVAASLTDWSDDFLARRWNRTSVFGALLDPAADKLTVVAVLLVLLSLGRVSDVIALVVIGREIAISALREWMAQIGASKSVAVNFFDKLKTTLQMIVIPLLLSEDRLFGMTDMQAWGTWLIYVTAALTLWSMAYYMKPTWPQIRERAK